MCGICGAINKSGQPVSQDLLHTMARTMRHRGPDDEGYHWDGGAGLGFQRLAIIDLSGGAQPMTNEDGTIWLVFNGEIYNFQSLRDDLEKIGRHRFQTHSDTEVIIHLYEEHGERCVNFLRGMFAFAIWDSRKQTLFLARDRFGKKPLVYADTPGAFVFASELKALLPHPAVRKTIHAPAIDHFLSYQYVPSPMTVFEGIHKLPPAHFLVYRNGSIRLERYWEPTFLPKTTLSQAEAGAQMMDKLREATRLRMIADVPLGAFLSGGIDSSVVVGLMSELSSKPIQTFSIGFEEEAFSELPFARRIAEQFGCDHHEFVVKPNAVEVLPKLAWQYGDPFADPSALPSYYLAQMTRQHVTVALNGDGGDENFGGYLRYQAMAFMRFWKHLPLPARKIFFTAVQALPDCGEPPLGLGWRLKRLMRLGLMEPREVYLNTLCYFHEDQKETLYSPEMKRRLASARPAPDYLRSILQKADRLPGVDAYLYTDMVSYLPECLMVKMDIATMTNSLEARSPLLDHEVSEFVGTFPPEWKLHGLFEKKYLLRKTLRGWLPKPILSRPKQGFGIPMAKWFRGDLQGYLRETLLEGPARTRGLFDLKTIEGYIAEHARGRIDHSFRLWALLMLEHWHRAYIDASVPVVR